MKLHKFTSLAVTAAMTMTMVTMASAETREVAKEVYGTPSSNITSNSDGTYTVSNTNLGAIIADFSALTDIDDATSVTVQFDTKLPVVSSGGKQYIAPVMFGVGDKAVRGTNGNGSTKSNYVKAGLVAYFGSENGTTYYVNGDTAHNYVQSVKDTDVRATITLNRTTGAYSGKVQTSSASVPFSGTTDVDNLTVLEVTTRGLSGYTFTFKNIKVSYTVPDTEPETPTDGMNVAISAVTTNNNLATLQDFIDKKDMVVHVNWYNYTENDENLAVVLSYFDADDHFLGYRNLNFSGALKAGQANSDTKINVTDNDLQGISGNAGGVPAKVIVCLWDGFGANESNSPYCDAVPFEAEPEPAE